MIPGCLFFCFEAGFLSGEPVNLKPKVFLWIIVPNAAFGPANSDLISHRLDLIQVWKQYPLLGMALHH